MAIQHTTRRRKPISQREARKAVKRVAALEHMVEQERSRYSQQYIGAKEIVRCQHGELGEVVIAIRTARKLGHAVVCIEQEDGIVRYNALPHPKEPIE